MRRLFEILSICSALAASYFWIHAFWWRSRQTINKLAESDPEVIVADLISQKADCKVALTGLIITATFQFALLFLPTVDEPFSGLWAIIFISFLYIFYFIGDLDCQRRRNRYLKKYKDQFPLDSNTQN